MVMIPIDTVIRPAQREDLPHRLTLVDA